VSLTLQEKDVDHGTEAIVRDMRKMSVIYDIGTVASSILIRRI
jgi:hypothetical protein